MRKLPENQLVIQIQSKLTQATISIQSNQSVFRYSNNSITFKTPEMQTPHYSMDRTIVSGLLQNSLDNVNACMQGCSHIYYHCWIQQLHGCYNSTVLASCQAFSPTYSSGTWICNSALPHTAEIHMEIWTPPYISQTHSGSPLHQGAPIFLYSKIQFFVWTRTTGQFAHVKCTFHEQLTKPRLYFFRQQLTLGSQCSEK